MRKSRYLEIFLLFLKIGAVGFGGGLAMIGVLHDYLIARKRWLDDNRFLKGLCLGQILPGPFVTNYVEYYGLLLRGWAGSIVAVVGLLIPSYLIVLVLSYLYFQFHHHPSFQSAFTGVIPVVIAILGVTSYRMARVFVKGLSEILILLLALGLIFSGLDMALTIIIGGILTIIIERIQGRPMAVDLLLLFLVFAKIGAVTFGGGYGALAIMEHEVVNSYHWLSLREFTDGLAIGQLTPGPVAITAVFIGYHIFGILGSLVATAGIFLPSYLMLLTTCLLLKNYEDRPLVVSFFRGTRPPIIAVLIVLVIKLLLSSTVTPFIVLLLIASAFLYLLKTPIPILIIIGFGLGLLNLRI